MAGRAAAKEQDQVVAIDMHLIQPPGTAPTVLVPHPFIGRLDRSLSTDVRIQGMAAATVGSTATNQPAHIPIGGSFVNPPANKGEITTGSMTVRINGQPAARVGDPAKTCNDPADLPVGTVLGFSTVRIGG